MYAVKSIFYTLQGEGMNAGRAAVFLRFTGCNLWSGRERDRASGKAECSRWCDTDFAGVNGAGGGRFDRAYELAHRVESTWGGGSGGRLVVCTGGEPLLQLDNDLIRELHLRRFEVAIETNGTIPVPGGVDWICVSPKGGAPLAVRAGNELKLVYPQVGIRPEDVAALAFNHFVLQPLDDDNRERNTREAVGYCMAHPQWRLGIQTHKQLGID